MSTVIKWLNDNAGAVQALSTLALVALTGWYAALTRRVANATRMAQRASVSADISIRREFEFYFAAVNTGQRPATEVRFELVAVSDEDLRSELVELTPFSRGIPYLAPGRRLHYSTDMSTFKVMEELPDNPKHFTYRVTYSDGDDSFIEDRTIDLASFDGVLFNSFDSDGTIVAKELRHLASEVRRAGDPNPLSRMMAKYCQFCSQSVSGSAKKCHHCGEWLTDPPNWRPSHRD